MPLETLFDGPGLEANAEARRENGRRAGALALVRFFGALALLALLVTACSSSAPDVAAPVEPAARVLEGPLSEGIERREERGSCYAAFDDVAEAWERVVGPLSAECRSVADSYTVRLVEVVPCTGPDGGPADGCTLLEQRVVYLRADLSPAGLVFVASHEWDHVLGGCEGDSDHDHRLRERWDLEDGVLGLAIANPPVGPCLEGP